VGLSSPQPTTLSGAQGFAQKQRYETITNPLQRRIGTWSERLFARHHITYADPWADRRLIEYAMAIPQHQIFRRGENKYIARKSMCGIMPEGARTQLQKVSPTPLYERALKDQDVDHISSYLSRYSPFLESDKLADHYENRLEGQKNEDFRFWLALCMKMWMHHHDL
jgi:asparagine synthase (glutamine-hydrolysing)